MPVYAHTALGSLTEPRERPVVSAIISSEQHSSRIKEYEQQRRRRTIGGGNIPIKINSTRILFFQFYTYFVFWALVSSFNLQLVYG
jgi:hypothetical protein